MAGQLRSIKWGVAASVLGAIVLLLTGCLVKPGAQPSQLTYSFPTTLAIKMGNSLPGTDIRYERMSDQGAYVTIKGQQALKRQGDSLDWNGSLGSGVTADLKLRIVLYNENELRLVGTAKIVVDGIAPKQGSIPTSSTIEFSGPIAYGLAKGAYLPGTTLTYVGSAADGAQMGGVEGYPYRKVGDSIFWEGSLRNGVYLRLDARVVQFDNEGLRVTGLATIWISS